MWLCFQGFLTEILYIFFYSHNPDNKIRWKQGNNTSNKVIYMLDFFPVIQ